MKVLYGNSKIDDIKPFNGRKAIMKKFVNRLGECSLRDEFGEIYIKDEHAYFLNNYFDGSEPRGEEWRQKGFRYSWALCYEGLTLEDLARCESITILGLKRM